MAGIYLHIPFCKSRCYYCDFYSNTDESLIDTFVENLCEEAKIRKDEVCENIKTIYFGGGTPSRLQQKHFEQIFDTLFDAYSIDSDAEITLEVNPDDLAPDYIRMLSALPFNRLSIGIQSFDDRELKFLNRRHSAQQATEVVKNAQQIGFENISIDLIYGIPNQTLEVWRKNLQQTIDLNIQHISAYHLIYEEDTKIYSLLQAGKINPVNEQTSTEMFSELINKLTTNGFLHYEIANFALPNRFSRHNSSYWRGESYIGLGPAAHSFVGDNRSKNISSLAQYLEAVELKTLNRTFEKLSLAEQYNEFILTGLRTMWGVDLQKLRNTFGEKFYTFCMKNAQKHINRHLLEIENDTLKLSREGIFISDGIMSDLMWVGGK
jgi:oxygen-independent coproporphyrinogen-3 oxidase